MPFDNRSSNIFTIGKISAISLALLAFPYCLAARAQIIRELETQPISHILPPSRDREANNSPLAQTAIAGSPRILPRIGARYDSSGGGYQKMGSKAPSFSGAEDGFF